MVRETRSLRPERRPTPEPGRVGPYWLGPVLGRGGMGTVYRARHAATGQEVALKLIAAHLSDSSTAVRRFEAEASALSRINHENVVRMLDFGHLADGTLFLATEVLEGRGLDELIGRRGRFPPAELVPLVRQICAGLQAAHDRDVVHRDLKPENIFITGELPDVQVKLFDFGVARLLDLEHVGERLTAAGVLVGTPRFAAPEQVLGEPDRIGPAVDLYALGVLLYGMLGGEPPFQGDDFGALLFQHVNDPPPPLEARGVAGPVARVVHWCLEKDPARRPISARVLAAAYRSAVQVAAAPRGRPPREVDEDLEGDEEESWTTQIYQPEVPLAPRDLDAPPPLIEPRRRSRRRTPIWLVWTAATFGLLSLSVLSALLVWVIFG